MREFLLSIIHVLEENFEHSEIICVNDASHDGSVNAIRETSQIASKTSISIINMSYFHGLEHAMTAGVDLAIGDFVFEFDNTILDFEPDMIMKVYKHSLEGFDIVSASPDKCEKITSKLFYRVFNKFANLPLEISTERFRVLSRRVINRISAMNRVILYRKTLHANCGLKTDQLKYPVNAKKHIYQDKQEQSYRSSLAVDSLILFTGVGYRFSMIMTMMMMALSLFVIAYTLFTYLTLHPVAGWTTTILFLSVSFFGVFGIMTVIVKYLQLLVDMVIKRTHYSFESIEKITK